VASILDGGWTPQAVVFDCDGLLVDTETCWTAAEADLFARRGRTLSEAEERQLIGMSVPETFAYLAARLGDDVDPVELGKELLQLVGRIVATEASPMPGAHAIVQYAERRVPVAVASNSPRVQLEAALAAGGFGGQFAVTVAGDEVAAPKPAPDIYLESCNRLGVLPSQCLAFEDSLAGATAAAGAGLRTVGVPTLSDIELPADLCVGSLEDPRLLAWLGSW
jgi:HAD superfamily hydrolase (TIGR01509 family)